MGGIAAPLAHAASRFWDGGAASNLATNGGSSNFSTLELNGKTLIVNGVVSGLSNLTYADDSIFAWDIDRAVTPTRGTGYDGVNVTGTLAGLDGGDVNATTDAIFRIVIGDSNFFGQPMIILGSTSSLTALAPLPNPGGRQLSAAASNTPMEPRLSAPPRLEHSLSPEAHWPDFCWMAACCAAAEGESSLRSLMRLPLAKVEPLI